MGEIADHPAPDGVGGALERVDRPEQRRDLGLGGALALERDQRVRHRFEVLDSLRDEVLENVRLVGEEVIQLGEPPCRLVGGRLGGRRGQPRERFCDRLGVLDPCFADDVERGLEPEHHVAQRAERPAIRAGRRRGHPLDRLLHRGGEACQPGKPAERRGAAEAVGHHRQVLGHRLGVRRVSERGEAVLDGGEGIPRLHQEDTQEKLPVAVGHAPPPVTGPRWPA